ncbi:MAG: N-acetyl-gamma-glutamyl-phosphate reductase [Phycisphaerales bacterium]|nr:N-acetyl-gamma-glutamyl-phosphate reductase [Phycisphaerales bacterium]
MPDNGNNLDLTRTVIIGAGGYTGAELAGVLSNHPQAQLVGLFASAKRGQSEQPQRFADLFPRFRGLIDLELQAVDLDAISDLKPHVVFLATPHEVSHELARALLEMGAIVIDLSAAFRLKDAALYPRHYGFEHHHPELLSQAVYGLPEIDGELIAGADLIAAPGCYPTSAILPLHPLVENEALAPNWQPIIDSTSGVSGAGRSAVLKSHFCEVSLQPYHVFSHRHAPEIAAHAGTPVIFTPHLGAFDRGILSTIHVRLARGWNSQRVADLFQGSYGDKPFVRLQPSGQWPSVAAVRHTNFCDIGWAVDEGSSHLIVVSAIDNLLKGAAGQAVQCMNIRLGLPEPTGLLKEAACTAPLS